MTQEDYDPGDLARLVGEALADRPSSTERTSRRPVALSFTDTRVFGALNSILERYVAAADRSAIFDELRTVLFDGTNVGDLRRLHTAVSHCRRCPDMEPEPVLPVGNVVDPDVCFVAELPWREMLAEQRMTEHVTAAGFRKERVMYTSMVRCDPSTARSVTPLEIENCSSYLLTELALTQPKVIVPLGNKATAAVLGTDVAITAQRGQLHWMGPWAVLPTYALGYIFRSEDAERSFQADLAQAAEFCYGK